MNLKDFVENGSPLINNNEEPNKNTLIGSNSLLNNDNIIESTNIGNNRIGLELAANTYGLTHLNDPTNNYEDYNVHINPVNTQEELNRERAANQGALEQAWNFAVQSVANEVVLGAALAASDIVDATLNIGNTRKGTNDFTNPVSEWIENAQESVRNFAPIYQENPGESWSVGDSGWWFSNAVSAFSSASMMLPSYGIVKGLGLIGKIGKVGRRISLGAAKAAKKISGSTRSATRIADSIERGAEIGTAALASRTMENYMEARGVHQEVYDTTLQEIKEMTFEEKQNLISRNPELKDMTDEQMASYIAGQSAAHTFKNDYALLLMDVMQFKAIGSLWKGVKSKTPTARMRYENRTAIDRLNNRTTSTNTTTSAVTNTTKPKIDGFFRKRWEYAKEVAKHPWNTVAAVEWSEGLEEGYQGIQTERGKEIAQMILDPEYNPRSIESYLTDEDIWEQAVWGVLGGVIFQKTGDVLGDIKRRINTKLNKKKLSDSDIAAGLTADEKIRLAEIRGRDAINKSFIDRMLYLNENVDPDEYEKDPDDPNKRLVRDGVEVHKKLTKEEAEVKKIQAVRSYIASMAMHAIDVGNYELLKEYVSNPAFTKYLKDAGVEIDSGTQTLENYMIDLLEDVSNKYSTNLHNVLRNTEIENEYVAKIVARELTREELSASGLEESLTDIQIEIENIDNSDGLNNNAYKKKAVTDYVRKKLLELEAQQNYYQDLYRKKQISEQAKRAYDIDIANRRKSLFNYLVSVNPFDSTTFNERFEQLWNTGNSTVDIGLENTAREISRLIDELNEELNIDANAVPNNIKDLIDAQIAIEDSLNLYREQVPKTQQDYVNRAQTVADNITHIIEKRLSDAAKKVEDWIIAQNDLNKAWRDIIENNVPELKNELDLLKIGYSDTDFYRQTIIKTIQEEQKKRNRAEERKKEATVDGNKTNSTRAESVRNDINRVEDAAAQTETNTNPNTTSPSTGEQERTRTTNTINTARTSEEERNPPAITREDVEGFAEASAREAAKTFDEPSIDDLAVGEASNVTFKIYRTSPNLIENALDKDTNSTEFNNLIDVIVEELIEKGVTPGIARASAERGLKIALNSIYRALNRRKNSKAEKFKNLADSIATKQKITITETSKPVTSTFPYTDPADIVYITNTRGGMEDITPSKEWSKHTDDMRSKPDGWGTYTDKNGNIYYYYKRSGSGRTGDNVTIWFRIEPTDRQKDRIVNELNKLTETLEPLTVLPERIFNLFKTDNATSTPSLNVSTTTLLDNELDSVIDDFIQAYIDFLGIKSPKGGRIAINLERLFSELVYNEELNIPIDTAFYILYNIKDYIRKSNKKYVFTDKRKLNRLLKNPTEFYTAITNARTKDIQLDNYMHISAPSQKSAGYTQTIDRLQNGDELEAEYSYPKGSNTPVSISFKKDGEEIGFISIVYPNINNTTYSISIGDRGGINYNVSKNGNIYTSNTDELFDAILNQDGRLWDILYKQYLYSLNDSNERPTDTEIEEFFNHPAIVKAFKDNVLVEPRIKEHGFTKNKYHNNRDRFGFFTYRLQQVVFYNPHDQLESEYRDSYNNWVRNVFINYQNTHKIQTQLDTGKKIKIKFAGMAAAYGKKSEETTVIIDEREHSINEIGLTYDKNPIIGVVKQDDKKVLINEKTGKIITTTVPFQIGTMGMLIGGREDTPTLALFTSANKLGDKIKKQLSDELTDILKGFQEKRYIFEEVSKKLSDLFNGAGVNNPTIFQGFSVVRNGDRIALQIGNNAHSYLLVINKFKKGSTTELGTGISYAPNGDINKSSSSINVNNSFINNIISEIVNNVTYNKTFFTLDNINKDNTSDNAYMYKENGKFVIELGGIKTIYDSFGEFVLKENAFNTTQGRNANGGYFNNTDKINSLFIDVTVTEIVDDSQSPVEGQDVSIGDTIRTASKSKFNSTSELLTKAKVEKSIIDFLSGDNDFGIRLISDTYGYDSRLTNAYAVYRAGRIYFSNTGANYVNSSSRNLMRILIHENLHDKFNEHDLFSRQGIVEELIDTYNALVETIDNIIKEGNKENVDYINALSIKQWLDNNNFNPTDYFTQFSKKKNAEYANMSEAQRMRIFAEEWLTESLTQPLLMNFMNNHSYRDIEVNVEGITNENKSIWQKIIDLLLKLFGKGVTNVRNNTIFAQQYLIVGNINNPVNNTNEAKNQNTMKEHNVGEDTTKNINESNEIQIDNIDITEDEYNDDNFEDEGSNIDNTNNYDDSDDSDNYENDRLATTTNVDQYTYSQEEQSILDNAPRDSQGRLLAPNGKPSNLTAKQYAQVRTKAFKNWFGEWEHPKQIEKTITTGWEVSSAHEWLDGSTVIQKGNSYFYINDDGANIEITKKDYDDFNSGKHIILNKKEETITTTDSNYSKVLDENGEPLVMYHRSDDNISIFDINKSKHGGFWFSKDSNYYINTKAKLKYAIPVFLNIRIPNSISHELFEAAVDGDESIEGSIKTTQFDGWITEDEHTPEFYGDYYSSSIVFAMAIDPNQIKSATDNVGTFNPNNNDIRYANTTTAEEYITDKIANDGNAIAKTLSVTRVTNMSDYLSMFAEQDQPLIAKMLDNGEITYFCR